MPTYDYVCSNCGNRFERRQHFSAEPVEVCSRCQGRAYRQFHSVAVIYKGSGFYTTDYARKHVSPPGNSENGHSSDSSSPPVESSAPLEKNKEEAKSSEA
ncbi:MAG: FmdB family transcriptional regulator [Chloroflexi bacterium]|nr:FmdB family transcriptional regulator [Chloroflexota bacterium]